MKHGIYEFDGWTIDYDFLKATRGDDCVVLRATDMDILVYLIEKAGSMAWREDLILHVWGERPPTNHAFLQAMSRLRLKLGTDAIKCIHKRGYYVDAKYFITDNS